MGNCNSCPSNSKCGKEPDSCGVNINPKNNIKNVIGVMSGKGGVGKSTISVTLAKELSNSGYKVGILDADITGPSVVRLLGIDKNSRAMGNSKKEILPVISKEGIKVISLNLLIEDEEQPVIWRGSILSNCVNQFWSDVLWEDLDYLIIDMPPGTGDVTLTVMQSIPITGVIVVSVPQSMISMIVSKSINMAKKMNVKIYGIVQNMSYIICPHCNERINIYDQEESNKLLEKTDLKLLAELPTTKTLSNISNGSFDKLENLISEQFKNIVNEITK